MKYVTRALIFAACWAIFLTNIGLIYAAYKQSLIWLLILPISLTFGIAVLVKAREDW